MKWLVGWLVGRVVSFFSTSVSEVIRLFSFSGEFACLLAGLHGKLRFGSYEIFSNGGPRDRQQVIKFWQLSGF